MSLFQRRTDRGLGLGERERSIPTSSLRVIFSRWCSAVGVGDFEGLCNLIVLEQFKNSVSGRVATYINEQKAETAAEAAALADDYVLTHRGSFGEPRASFGHRDSPGGESGSLFGRPFSGGGRGGSNVRDPEKVCHYCHKPGHWKVHCPLLRAKPRHAVKDRCPADWDPY